MSSRQSGRSTMDCGSASAGQCLWRLLVLSWIFLFAIAPTSTNGQNYTPYGYTEVEYENGHEMKANRTEAKFAVSNVHSLCPIQVGRIRSEGGGTEFIYWWYFVSTIASGFGRGKSLGHRLNFSFGKLIHGQLNSPVGGFFWIPWLYVPQKVEIGLLPLKRG